MFIIDKNMTIRQTECEGQDYALNGSVDKGL